MARENRRLSLLDQNDGADGLDNLSSDHADERWLISYADMMTLLFGLFVMLYAIAMETQGQPEKFFPDLAPKAEENPAAPSQASVIARLEHDLEAAKSSLAVKTDQLAKMAEKLTENQTALTEANKDSEKNKEMLAALKAQIDQLTLEKASLSEQTSSAKGLSDQASKLQNQITALKALLTQKSLEVQKFEEQRKQGSVTSEAEISKLKKEISEQQLVIQKLSAQNEMLIKENLSSLMMVVLQWTSEKHDLDLEVTDPNGRLYNFKNRSFQNSKAKFVIDSRNGPGVEMWQTPNIVPGEYKADFVFYNNYGNQAPATVSGSIITKKGEVPIKPFKLDFSQAKKKSFKIVVSPEGNVTVNEFK